MRELAREVVDEELLSQAKPQQKHFCAGKKPTQTKHVSSELFPGKSANRPRTRVFAAKNPDDTHFTWVVPEGNRASPANKRFRRGAESKHGSSSFFQRKTTSRQQSCNFRQGKLKRKTLRLSFPQTKPQVANKRALFAMGNSDEMHFI